MRLESSVWDWVRLEGLSGWVWGVEWMCIIRRKRRVRDMREVYVLNL